MEIKGFLSKPDIDQSLHLPSVAEIIGVFTGFRKSIKQLQLIQNKHQETRPLVLNSQHCLPVGQRVNLNLTAVMDQNTMEQTSWILEVSIEKISITFNISLSLPYNPFSLPSSRAQWSRWLSFRDPVTTELRAASISSVKGHNMSNMVFIIINSLLYNSHNNRTTILLLLLLILLLIIMYNRATPNNNNLIIYNYSLIHT